jgi:hypothetical protein
VTASGTEDYSVFTPERVSLRYDIAGIGSRGAAALIDTTIQAVVGFAVVIVIIFITALGSRFGGFWESPWFAVLTLILYALGSFFLLWGYYLVEVRNRQHLAPVHAQRLEGFRKRHLVRVVARDEKCHGCTQRLVAAHLVDTALLQPARRFEHQVVEQIENEIAARVHIRALPGIASRIDRQRALRCDDEVVHIRCGQSALERCVATGSGHGSTVGRVRPAIARRSVEQVIDGRRDELNVADFFDADALNEIFVRCCLPTRVEALKEVLHHRPHFAELAAQSFLKRVCRRRIRFIRDDVVD